MYGLLTYLVGTIIVFAFSYRLYVLYQKEANPFIKYFGFAIFFYGLGELIGLLLLIFYFILGNPALLYWLDVITRFSLYAGSAFMVQLPLYLFFPKSTKRIYATYVIFFIALALLAYNLSLAYQPIIDSSGFVRWDAPLSISIIMAFILALTWLSTSAVFLGQFIKGKYKSVKALSLGLGFLFMAAGVIFQDFATTTIEFSVLYLSLLVGGTLILIGFTAES